MSERTHDEFCFNTDLYQDDVEGYMCICNRLDSARHQERIDQRELTKAAVAAEREISKALAKEQHQLILMLLDQMHGRALIDLATQENHNPDRHISWWRDERKFLHIIINEEES